MCGIVGISGIPLHTEEARVRLRRMGLFQFHRGPDGWGEWLDDGIALGHNRLAILDLECGAQPMASADGRVNVVFNGEIYNFQVLRRELEQLGHHFRTDHSDTEVIVEGYREWGTGVFAKLEGMFGLAIWDGDNRRLVLGRDRIGIKPLYFARVNGGVLFASEPKAIIASGLVPAALHSESLLDYFVFRAPARKQTLLQGVEKVPPGSWMSFAPDQRTEPVAYWHPEPTLRSAASLADAEAELLEAIDAAVESHLISDVPVGVFLSGGVDSSLVAALISKHATLDAFTVGTHSALDESGYARIVADHLGQRLHVRMVTPDDFLKRFDAWSYYNDDPVADPSALALMVLAEHARDEGMTVMLAGEGADELFGGYPSYQRFALYRSLGRLPFSGTFGDWAAGRIGGKDGDYLQDLPRPRFFGHAHITDRAARRSLFTPDLAAEIPAWESTAFGPAFEGVGAAREAMLFDQMLRLPDDVLSRTDRATMSASLEARVPFLDRRVVEFANGLPDRWCMRLVPPASKHVLKRVAARHVPPEVIYRQKLGFELPVDEWLRTQFRDRVHTFLDERAVPFLDYDYLRAYYEAPAKYSKRWAALVWAWLVLEQWQRLWLRDHVAPLAPKYVTSPESYELLRDDRAPLITTAVR